MWLLLKKMCFMFWILVLADYIFERFMRIYYKMRNCENEKLNINAYNGWEVWYEIFD